MIDEAKLVGNLTCPVGSRPNTFRTSRKLIPQAMMANSISLSCGATSHVG